MAEDASAFSADRIAQIRSHPQFPEAIRVSADGFVRSYQGNRLVNLVASDRGRAFVAAMALYLHFAAEAGGPAFTPAALKALALREGVCSPGRTGALIALMQWAGYLTADLVPTERLFALNRERWSAQLTGLGLIFPEALQVRDRLNEPDMTRAYAFAQADQFLAGFRVARYAPEMALFSDRNAGMMVLFSLLLAGPGELSLKGLARRFHVSRPHVTRLFQEAARADLLTSADPARGAAIIAQPLSEALERLFAVLFLLNTDCVRRTLMKATPAPR